MKLRELLRELKTKFLIDEILKAYLYKDRIEIIDYTSEYEYEDENKNIHKEPDFYGRCITLYLKNNEINYIDPCCISYFTKANKNALIYLLNLIDTIIEDYNDYDKLEDKNKESIEDIRNIECIDIY